RDYATNWADSNSTNQIPPRRDLQMETVLEILNGKRFVTCHSYQQGEINMLMQLAVQFGFRINTFTHVLEGYKIAKKLKAHGVSASTFSDWWAYKYEVIDAIPYNAAMLGEAGVNICINSDDAEMGRRLNQEAAKGVKYGGMSAEDAFKMVTLNPAKALHIDEWVGSIAIGKHGDIVVWTDHPLSIYARPQQTFIDGRRYFDEEKDLEMRNWVATERKRLISKILATPEKGKSSMGSGKPHRLYECETRESDYNQSYE
ncbi:MAG TPA: amidohydrolase, partial [Bacteroidetes bacterium]|nr:amidohydrolase [Bacteroidota bacterium]